MARYVKNDMPQNINEKTDKGETVFLLSPKVEPLSINYSRSARKMHRRRYSAEEKLKILQEAESCVKRGELTSMLHERGIHRSMLATWKRQRDQGVLQVMSPKKRGPRAVTGSLRFLIVQLAEINEKYKNVAQRMLRLESLIKELIQHERNK
jgi:transposase-like protein